MSEPSPAPRVCIACGLAPRATLRLRNGHDLLQCPRCRLAWWRWPAFDAARFYDRSYFQSDTAGKGYHDYASLETGIRRTARARLARVEQVLDAAEFVARRVASRARRLFEIGCGTGLFLDEARQRGWEVAGAEISDYAAGAARQRGLNVLSGAGLDLLTPASAYDCIVLWDVIEHLEHPAETLATAASALRPGGVLALSTGDITSLCARLSGRRWHLFNLPEHLFFFSPESLRRLLEKSGCQQRRVLHEVNWIPASYAAERLGLSVAFSRVTRLAPWLGGCVLPATLFDVIGIYAVRAAI